MNQEVEEYANKKILESSIRMVPGHYPDFKSKEHVDLWLDMHKKAFEDYFGEDYFDEDMEE